MKRIISYLGCLLMCGLLSNIVLAQTKSTETLPARKLIDPVMGKRLAYDWNARNSALTDKSVKWFNSEYGFYGTYTNENQEYLTRYDKQGNYVETMTKKEWNAMVPLDLKSSFDRSSYAVQKVACYWEVFDQDRKGYYFELNDQNGKLIKVWADEEGNFTTTPYPPKVKN